VVAVDTVGAVALMDHLAVVRAEAIATRN